MTCIRNYEEIERFTVHFKKLNSHYIGTKLLSYVPVAHPLYIYIYIKPV